MEKFYPGAVMTVDDMATELAYRAALTVNSVYSDYVDYVSLLTGAYEEKWTAVSGDIKVGTGGYKADSVTISQNVISALAVLSNGNVMLQQNVDPHGYSIRCRLHCTHCSQVHIVSNVAVITAMAKDRLIEECQNFCVKHRHEDPQGYVAGKAAYQYKYQTPYGSGPALVRIESSNVAVIETRVPYQRKYRSEE